MLDVIREYPEGLTAARIEHLTHLQRAMADGVVPSMLSQAINRGEITRVKGVFCEVCCASAKTLYKIAPVRKLNAV